MASIKHTNTGIISAKNISTSLIKHKPIRVIMGKTFSFIHSRENSLHIFHYLNTTDEKLVTRAWPDKIDQKWWDNWDFRPHDLYNVSGLSPVHNAIYLSLSWKLIIGMNRLGIPLWYRDEASKEIGKDPEFIKWEYKWAENGKPRIIVDDGFVRARSSPGPVNNAYDKKPIDQWAYEHRNLAGIFSLESFEDFIGIQKPSLLDDYSEVNYFALKESAQTKALIAALQSDRHPSLEKILDSEDIFIDIFIGLDLGYPDSVLIKSKSDIGANLEELTKMYQDSIERFETRMSEIYDMDDFTNAIAELVNL